MKFVKGDAIAGILITIVNITAGFIIGVSQQGLGLGEAMGKFTLFTIGDGLVSQIPALLVSVAAGIAVTRVSDKEGEFVGRDMLGQLGREPQALATTGAVLCALALVPGLPFVPFFLMSSVFFAGALKVQRKSRDAERRVREGDFRPKVFAGILLRISVGGTLKLQEEAILPGSVQTFRNEIFEKYGVVVPEINFDVDPKLVGLKAIVFFQGVKLEETGSTMAASEEGKGVFTVQVVEMVRRFTEAHLVELINDTHTRMLLEVHQAGCEDLIHSVVPELVSITELTTLLRQLVAERVSIRSLSTVFQAIAEYKHGIRSEPAAKSIGGQRGGSKHMVPISNCEAAVTADSLGLLAAARQAMSRNISAMVANERWEIRAWVLEGEVDQLLSKTAIAGVPLNPRLVERIMDSAYTVAQQNVVNAPVVLLASRYARALLYSVIRGEFENIFVLAIDEICEEAKLLIEGEICAINDAAEESSQLEMKEAA
jgi:flagellar biosynthesis component FlhA